MSQDGQTGEGGTVKSVRRAFQIIEKIRERNGARVSELATEFDVAKSTIHSHVSTLREAGYLIQEGDEYQIGALFLRLGDHARTRREEYEMASQKVEELAKQSEERSQFAVEEQGRIIFLYREGGSHAVYTGTQLGGRRYMHTSSAGKVILAHLPDRRVREIIDQWGLPRVTENTITTEEELHEELETIREQGYAVNMEENIKGLRAVGAPIRTNEGEVIGGLSISGPTHRLKGNRLHEELADLVRGEANELELKITYS